MKVIAVWAFCHAVIIIVSPPIWAGIAVGYLGDSFWTLSLPGRFGVVTISVIGIAAISIINAVKTRAILGKTKGRWPLPIWIVDVTIGLLIFAVIFSTSPQVFYSFYRLIISDLPAQWVINGIINWDRFYQIILPWPGGSLADHLGAVACGGIVLFTSYLHYRQMS